MTASSPYRVVVTGLGSISNLALDTNGLWKAVCEGRSGISTITSFEQDDAWSTRIAGEIRNWDPTSVVDRREVKRMDRTCLLAMAAADEAVRDCGVDFSSGDPSRRGVIVGSGVGGIMTIEDAVTRLIKGGPRKISAFTVPRLMVNASAGNISLKYNLQGASSAVATACASGGHAIVHACELIHRGMADLVLAGGSEAAVSPLCIGAFSAMKALSNRNDDPLRASRPFDRDRDGFVMGEGAAILVLEERGAALARGARIHGEILGAGLSSDAHHLTAPEPTGRGAVMAMRHAIDEAGVNPDDIDYINAHGTSTSLGDAAEVSAVKTLFGPHASRLVLSSTKSMMGHTLGAAGGLESIVVIKAIAEGVIPPTINLDNPDEGFDLDFAAMTAQERDVRVAINNSFGFGGHNVSIVFSGHADD